MVLSLPEKSVKTRPHFSGSAQFEATRVLEVLPRYSGALDE